MATIPARRLLLTTNTTTTTTISGLAARPCLRASAPHVSASLRAAFSSRRHVAAARTGVTGVRQQGLSRHQQQQTAGRSIRWSTTSATGSKIWTFEEIQSLSTSPSSESKATLIDVREPGELQSTGRIPGAVNVPITTWPDSFHISEAEFEDRFGFARPPPDAEVVFYCKAGVRSRAAAGIAREAGWKDVGEYPGSWIEWSGKGGEVQRLCGMG
ncbi:Rhodanese-like domain-containing protein [Nemania abortiva]|nr:Rhodanese-like domain-containing protein [Nemania abortiva]